MHFSWFPCMLKALPTRSWQTTCGSMLTACRVLLSSPGWNWTQWSLWIPSSLGCSMILSDSVSVPIPPCLPFPELWLNHQIYTIKRGENVVNLSWAARFSWILTRSRSHKNLQDLIPVVLIEMIQRKQEFALVWELLSPSKLSINEMTCDISAGS